MRILSVWGGGGGFGLRDLLQKGLGFRVSVMRVLSWV